MEATIKVFTSELPVSLLDATVIHADKFTRTTGGWFNLPVTSTLYTDVVFRSKDTGADWPLYIKDYDVLLYQGQEVSVISVKHTIIGYIDKQTNQYYYTTGNFSGALGIGISGWWLLLACVVTGILVYLFLDNQQALTYLFIPLAVFYLFYLIQKWVINYRARKAIDGYLR
jgi:hypothetical protein